MSDKRADYLIQTAQALVNAASSGVLTNGQPVTVYRAETINGPRAGAVRLYAGLGTGLLFRALASDGAALGRQFFGWPFQGDPSVYLDGQALRLEAPWPAELARGAIRLYEVNRKPRGNGQWVLGVNELGQTVIGRLDDNTPNWLLGGTTGSGKTVALLGAALQLSRDPATRLVLVDGKEGAGLIGLVGLPGVVGPLATGVETARAALGWVHGQLQARYRMLASEGAAAAAAFARLVVLVDEFQELTPDPLVAELLRRLASKGRAARIHLLLATQHPTVDAFGDAAVKRNLPGRVALRVLDAEASRVVVGAPAPRADRLTGAGDAYAIGSRAIHRTQLVLVDERELRQAERQPPQIAEWPEFRAEDAGQEPTVRWAVNGVELAYALRTLRRGEGRPALEDALEAAELGRPGAKRGIRLLEIGREILDTLPYLGLDLVEVPPRPVIESRGTQPGEIVDVEAVPA